MNKTDQNKLEELQIAHDAIENIQTINKLPLIGSNYKTQKNKPTKSNQQGNMNRHDDKVDSHVVMDHSATSHQLHHDHILKRPQVNLKQKRKERLRQQQQQSQNSKTDIDTKNRNVTSEINNNLIKTTLDKSMQLKLQQYEQKMNNIVGKLKLSLEISKQTNDNVTIFGETCDVYVSDSNGVNDIKDYDYETDDIDFTKDKCILLNVKGLPKSGTNWLKATLNAIYDKVCDKTDNLLPLCNANITGAMECYKHRMESYSKKLCYFDKIKPFQRWCDFVTFRDPRNRIVSVYKSDLTQYKDQSDSMLNYFIQHKFSRAAEKLARWWNVFENIQKEEKKMYEQFNTKDNNLGLNGKLSKLHTFTYLYEDFLINPKQILCKMIHFMGYNDILDVNDLNDVYLTIKWDSTAKNKYDYDTKRSWFNFDNQINPMVDVCKYQNFMTNATLRDVNKELILLKPRILYLFGRFHQRCPIVDE